MRFCLKFTTILFIIFAIFVWGPGGILTQSLNKEAINIIIPKKSSTYKVAEILCKKNIIGQPYFFFVASVINKLKRQGFKYGEYEIPPHISLCSIVNLLCSGQTVLHYFTVPEGMTISELCKKLEEEALLIGEIYRKPQEGMILPETYDFQYGDNRQDFLDRMNHAMETTLKQLWVNRESNIAIKSVQEALILASIVEKETGIANERPLVASVFLNRLKIGMRLQSDPTVIYGLTLGKNLLKRNLSLKDLKGHSPYNTYNIYGLPPTPIACPGKEALQAVLHPIITEYLYFVADGTGGHNFSKGYDIHLQNVQKWRKINRVKKNA